MISRVARSMFCIFFLRTAKRNSLLHFREEIKQTKAGVFVCKILLDALILFLKVLCVQTEAYRFFLTYKRLETFIISTTLNLEYSNGDIIVPRY